MNKFLIIVFALTSFSTIADKGHHHHGQINVSHLKNPPSVKVKLHPDAMSGWNLEVVTQNFKFTPRNVNQEHEKGTGHAHLYIDGVKIGRLYNHWRHISGLSSGRHTIKVTLNSNDHQDYVVNGVVVGDQVEIEQK